MFVCAFSAERRSAIGSFDVHLTLLPLWRRCCGIFDAEMGLAAGLAVRSVPYAGLSFLPCNVNLSAARRGIVRSAQLEVKFYPRGFVSC